MDRNKSRFENLVLAGIAGLILLSGCASTKPAVKETKNPKASKQTPQQLILDNRKEEAMQEFAMPVDINAMDEDGNTVLHVAAKVDDANLITYFIFRGADPELKNHEGDTPLHLAIKNDSMQAAKALSAVSSTLFSRDAEGVTALDRGLIANDAYYDIFITTKAGELRDVEGQTIVHYFVRTKNLKGIRECIAKGIPISVEDDNKKTPLDVAFENLDSKGNDDTENILDEHQCQRLHYLQTPFGRYIVKSPADNEKNHQYMGQGTFIYSFCRCHSKNPYVYVHLLRLK